MIATLKIQRRTRSRRPTTCRGIRLHRVTLTPDPRPLTPGLSRRGVSLLEVLIAVFVLTFGLMSVAMVIPAGQKLMVDASKSDRSAACGRAALDDIQIRGWFNSPQWVQRWLIHDDLDDYAGTIRSARPNSQLLYGETYLLDPLFFAYQTDPSDDTTSNAYRGPSRHFPYSAYPGRELALTGNARQWPDRALARRITFPEPGGTFATFLPENLAERLTTWADELIFSLEGDSTRPRQLFATTDGQTWALPTLPGDGMTPGATRLRSDDMGRFTWAAMITPIVPLTYQGTFTYSGTVYPRIDPDLIGQWTSGSYTIPTLNPARITQYEVSVVVFYQRNLLCPSVAQIRTVSDVENIRERSVYAQLIGGGIGGGDVVLYAPLDATHPAGYIDVQKNDWIMLKGLDRVGFVGNHGTVTPLRDEPNYPSIPVRTTVCKWYRVVSVDDDVEIIDGRLPAPNDVLNPTFPNPTDPSNPFEHGQRQYVTLVGPDWQVDTTYTTNGFNWQSDIAEAALVKDVVGVYTTVIDVTAY